MSNHAQTVGPATCRTSNKRGEACFTQSPGKLHPIAAVMQAARALWPLKTAAHLAARTDVSERAAKYWLARKTDLSAEHLADLLHSDDGLRFLEALMGDARPAWWRGFKRTAELSELRRQQEEQRKRIELLERQAAD